MSGGLARPERTPYMVVYAFGQYRIPDELLDTWSLSDLNGYLAFFRRMSEAAKKKTKPGEVYTEKTLDQLLGGKAQ